MEIKTSIPNQKKLAFCTEGETLDVVISSQRELILTKSVSLN